MRQIKFRGKQLNGEWAYGDLLRIGGGCIIYIGSKTETATPDIPKESNVAVELFDNDIAIVIPNTIGQFTGLADCNGKEIYEGDIVKYDDTPYNAYASPYSGEVVFYCGSWRVKTKGYGVEWVYPYLFRDDFANRKTELLGNIHDNPEMINQPTEV